MVRFVDVDLGRLVSTVARALQGGVSGFPGRLKTVGLASFSFLKTHIPAVVFTVISLVVAVLAVLHPGVPEARVDLNEGGVWVTNEERRIVGHLNYPARTLESGLRVDATSFDISQFERDIVFEDRSGASVATVDPASASLSATMSFGFDGVMAQGGNQVGILDPESGHLWVSQASQVPHLGLGEQSALEYALPGGVVAASTNGIVVAASAQTNQIVTVKPAGIGYQTSVEALADASSSNALSIAMVGDEPVIVDHTAAQVRLPGGKTVELPVRDVELQQSGEAADSVVLAGPNSLWMIALDNGEIEEFSASENGGSTGQPASPVMFGGCAYGAWTGTGYFARWCDDDNQSTRMEVDTLAAASNAVFRINRDVIVLNDTGSGMVWLPEQNMVLIDNWDEIDADLKAQEEDEESPQTTDEVVDPDREKDNRPPVANDDEFGVRPGATTMLPVLMNDSDPDGDLLTASVVTPPDTGTVSPTRGGAALQIHTPAEATGSFSFVYQASDGRGGTDSANVAIDVRGWEVNEAPEQRRVPTVVVESGAEVEYNVLPDWVDPDGDQFFLESVIAPEGVQVQFRQEGALSIHDLGSTPGVKRITIVMSDGRDSREGYVNLDIRETGNLPPVANGDFVVVRAGEPISVSPLENDTDPNGDRLALVSVSAPPPGTSITPQLDLGSFEFIASAKGTYYLTYTVTDGPASAVGVIRIDVLDRTDDSVPVAQDDLVTLPAGGVALAAVLNNDSDPGGGVLVVQSVRIPDDSPLQVTLVDHHLLRITSQSGLEEPTRLSYTVSNGVNEASANVMVLPVAAIDASAPPQPQPDRLRVRVGDVGSVDVVANDRSVNGLPLTVDPKLEHDIPESAGLAFVSGKRVRFQAKDEPGSYRLTYTVRDPEGNFASSNVTIEVIEESEGANSAPQPKDLVAWAIAGQMSRIPVPLDGIDPDGDSVTLVGLQQPADKGFVELGTNWLEYTPSRDVRGTDSFTYIVEDRLGKQAVARVRVGIAPPSATNQVPTAVPDSVRVRPNRVIAVDVLANDIDPDGDALSLVEDSVSQVGDTATRLEQRDNLVVVGTPSTDATMTIGYEVTDGRGGHATGLLTVHVDSQAPLRAPQAHDDIVTAEEVDRQGAERVHVSVLDNDIDPDGDRDDLIVSSTDPGVSVVDQQLVIDVMEKRRSVVYRVEDIDGLEGYAVVSVPGYEVERPKLNSTLLPVSMRAGEEMTLELSEYVIVRPGRKPELADPEAVKSALGASVKPVEQGGTQLVVTADQNFAGSTSVTFEVADGPVDDDNSALRARLTIPIEVTSQKNRPPIFRPSPLSVTKGEGQTTVNLCSMVEDPDGTDPASLEYRLDRVPSELSASLSGCQLSVELTTARPVGLLGSIDVSIDDGSGKVTGALPVHVAASTRPLIQASEAVLGRARPGVTEQLDVTQYLLNPFPGKPMTIVGSPRITSGEGTVDARGLSVSVTPKKGYIGTVLVEYTVADATEDPSRRVKGIIRAVVRDKPEAPKNVVAVPTGPGVATVSFEAGANNGAPISSFTVVSESGVSATCASTECAVTGLSNGDRHRFRVTADNEMGTSGASGWSAPVLVDVQPNQPSPPRLEPKDQAVAVHVAPTTSLGSPVTHYEVTLQPGDMRQRVAADGDLVASFTGLTNGTSYRASVQAFNRAEKPSTSSELSSGAVPFGKPEAPTQVSIARGERGDNTGAVNVTWSLGGNNGSAIETVTVRVMEGAEKLAEQTVSAKQTSTSVTGIPYGKTVRAVVTATNRAGDSKETASAQPIRMLPVALPQPEISQLAVTGHGKVTVSQAFAQSGFGVTAREQKIQYRMPGSGTWKDLQDNLADPSMTPGEVVTLEFRSRALIDEEELVSKPVQATTQNTYYDVPLAPEVTIERGQDTIILRVPSQSGSRGLQVTHYAKVEGLGTEQISQSGELEIPTSPGKQYTIEVWATDSLGQRGASTSRVESIPPRLSYGLHDCQDGATSCQVWVKYEDASRPRASCTYQADDSGGSQTKSIRTGQEAYPPGWSTTITDDSTFRQRMKSQTQAPYLKCENTYAQ